MNEENEIVENEDSCNCRPSTDQLVTQMIITFMACVVLGFWIFMVYRHDKPKYVYGKMSFPAECKKSFYSYINGLGQEVVFECDKEIKVKLIEEGLNEN